MRLANDSNRRHRHLTAFWISFVSYIFLQNIHGRFGKGDRCTIGHSRFCRRPSFPEKRGGHYPHPERPEEKPPMKAIDLFCGAGGFSTGIARSGFQVVFANDIDKDACQTYRMNHPETLLYEGSISDLTGKAILDMLGLPPGSIDLIVGGPPCQGFSTIGKKDERDPRNSLFLHYLRTVKEIEPKIIVFENVSGFKGLYGGRIFEKACEKMAELGYNVEAKLLNALHYGAPQNRTRTFIVGYSPGIRFEWPLPTHGDETDTLFGDSLEKPLTLRDAIGDLPPVRAGETASDYLCPPQNPFQEARRKNNPKLMEHTGPNHGEKLLQIIRMVPPGGSILDVPKRFRPRGYFANTYARLRWDEPSPTITRNFGTPSSSRCIHPEADRGLTTREGARIQTFDDDYIFWGSRASKNLQIGNAVPPLLAEAIGIAAYKSLKSGESIERRKHG